MTVNPHTLSQMGGKGGIAAQEKITPTQRATTSAANKDQISADPRATYIPGHGAAKLTADKK